MGIIAGTVGTVLAACAFLLAWPLGRLVGGYWRGVVVLALVLVLTGGAMLVLLPPGGRGEAMVWPIGVIGSGALVAMIFAYKLFFGWLWRKFRWLRGQT